MTSQKPLVIVFAFLVLFCGLADRASAQCLPQDQCCGNDICDLGDTRDNCPEDCFQSCGNGVCQPAKDETPVTCPQDCPGCGDTYCDEEAGEDSTSCPGDCGTCTPQGCSGRCGTVGDGCGSMIDCGTCSCTPNKPTFTASATRVHVGESITFTANASLINDPPTPLWDLGNGDHLSGSPLTYSYPAAGTYPVVLTANDSECGSTQLSDPRTVTVASEPFCDFTDIPPHLQICCGNQVCDGGENPNRCGADCPGFCGDTYCTPQQGETSNGCPQDCCYTHTCAAGCAGLPAFTVSDPTPVVFQVVTFSAFPDHIVGNAVNWDFGDAEHCLGCPLTVTHQYRTAGQKVVRLTATENVCNEPQLSFPQFLQVHDRAIVRGDGALLVSHDLPDAMPCSTPRTVSITMQNIGSTTWTSEDGYALGAKDDSDPLSEAIRIPLPAGLSVGGFETVTFSFPLSSTVEGVFHTDWQMVHTDGRRRT